MRESADGRESRRVGEREREEEWEREDERG